MSIDKFKLPDKATITFLQEQGRTLRGQFKQQDFSGCPMCEMGIPKTRMGKSDVFGTVVRKLLNSPVVARTVSTKRARKLRKLGESVYWSVFEHAYVWDMHTGLTPPQRYFVRQYLRGFGKIYDTEGV